MQSWNFRTIHKISTFFVHVCLWIGDELELVRSYAKIELKRIFDDISKASLLSVVIAVN